jgi:hypothetical protein
VVISEPVSEFVPAIAGKVITPEARGYTGFAEPVARAANAGGFRSAHRVQGRQQAVAHGSAN